MANPLSNEQEIYAKIKEDNLTIHPLIWELMAHHINNDLHMINLIIGATVMDDEPLTKADAQKILSHTKAVADFLLKLAEATKSKDV